MKVKCITCLAKGKLKDAEVVYRGFSYCREHLIKVVKDEEVIFKKMEEKEKKGGKSKLNLSKERHASDEEIMEIGKEG